MSNQRAIEQAAQYGVTIQFDELAQSPFYYYTSEDGVEHVVWFDDVRSMNAKLPLIPEFSLNGAGVWQIMNFFPGLWLVVASRFAVTKI
jgi:spore germination protein